jgi:GNAT superfamily N-acetyltransferase
MKSRSITLRHANPTDLDAINHVIEAAVMGWNLPERVKRLSLPSYRYTPFDFEHLDMVVAEDAQGRIVGVAAWEPAAAKETPADHSALLLHGIYVDPARQGQGIGRQLFRAAEEAARRHGYDGLLVKAQADANDFFIAQGMESLPVEDPSRQYTNRFWKRVADRKA